MRLRRGPGQVRAPGPRRPRLAPTARWPQGPARCSLTWSLLAFPAPGVPGHLLLCPQLLSACGGPVLPRGLLRALPGEGMEARR